MTGPRLLLGDPAHFSVVGGANPHTRDAWGRRKRVDRDLAIRQWTRLRDLLVDLGFEVHVIPPDPARPGLVYPANAGVRIGRDFVLSRLTPTRAAEEAVYARVVADLGLRCRTTARRFEGEADLFPAGGGWIFTSGPITRQRFVPRWGLPPWRRVYGFRSDASAIEEILPLLEDLPVHRIALVDEAYYHGDTCLASFGAGRSLLLAYRAALDPASWENLTSAFGDRLVPLSRGDAEIYAANAFAFDLAGRPHLLLPEGVSEDLLARIRERGTTPMTIDVSEFLKKGGGSVKCMIGDLGDR